MKRISVLLLAILAIAPGSARAANPVSVYAHRGGAGLAPENTLGAFRQTATRYGDQGVGLEMDTQLTSDGKLVIIHDDSLNRTTNCTGAVNAHTFAEVTACDARRSFPGWPNFEPVPATQDVLTEGRDSGWRLMIELKDIPGEANFDAPCAEADTFAALLASTAFPLDRLIVESFWPPCLDRLKLDNPNVRTLFLTTSQLTSAAPNAGFWASQNAAFSKASGYNIVSPDNASPDLNSTVVSAIQALGLPVIVWTVDAPTDIAAAIGWGVDGVISNRPDLVLTALN